MLNKNLIDKEELDRVLENVDKYNFKSFFEQDHQIEWFEKNLRIKERTEIHPIFWTLTDDNASCELSENLEILKRKCKNYHSIIKKLINEDFDSRLTEIEVMAYFYDNFDPKNIEYEPLIKLNKRTNADLKIDYEGKNYFIEITSLQDDKLERERENIKLKIENKMGGLDLDYDIFINKYDDINVDDKDIDQFLNGLKSFIEEKSKTQKTLFYERSGLHASIEFVEAHNSNGKIELRRMRYPPFHRIKYKLLDETDQLPIDGYNIIVIKLITKLASRDSHIKQAFYGKVDKRREITRLNGFIDHPNSKQVSGVIFYKKNFKERKLYLNPNAVKQLDNTIINIFE